MNHDPRLQERLEAVINATPFAALMGHASMPSARVPSSWRSR